jgi:hypothetical protein
MEFDEIQINGLGWTRAKRAYQAEVRRLYLKYCDKVLTSSQNDEVAWRNITNYTYSISFLKTKDLLKAYDYWKGLAE